MPIIKEHPGEIQLRNLNSVRAYKSRLDTILIIHCTDIPPGTPGKFPQGYYIHHLTADPKNENEVRNLREAAYHLQNGGNISVHLVERRYHTKQTREEGRKRPTHWAVPQYKVLRSVPLSELEKR